MSKNILDEENVGDLRGGELTVIFNTESIWHFHNNAEYRKFVTDCRNIAIDGAGLQLALRLKGHRVRRYHGPDLCDSVLANSSSPRNKILIVGGSLANDGLVKGGLAQGFLPLPIVNGIDDFNAVFADLEKFFLANAGPKLIFVSLGLPKQEIFCHWLLAKISERPSLDKEDFALLPVGAALDFLTGQKKRAGRGWQRIGLEWLPRLVREPRMFIRVYRSFTALMSLILTNSYT